MELWTSVILSQIQCHCGNRLNFNISVVSVFDCKSASKKYCHESPYVLHVMQAPRRLSVFICVLLVYEYVFILITDYVIDFSKYQINAQFIYSSTIYIYITLRSSTCFEQHAAHHQEDQLYHHSLWYRHPL